MPSFENFRIAVFQAVAEQLNFRMAAEELYFTQPAVSLQFKEHEEDLGVQLFLPFFRTTGTNCQRSPTRRYCTRFTCL